MRILRGKEVSVAKNCFNSALRLAILWYNIICKFCRSLITLHLKFRIQNSNKCNIYDIRQMKEKESERQTELNSKFRYRSFSYVSPKVDLNLARKYARREGSFAFLIKGNLNFNQKQRCLLPANKCRKGRKETE